MNGSTIAVTSSYSPVVSNEYIIPSSPQWYSRLVPYSEDHPKYIYPVPGEELEIKRIRCDYCGVAVKEEGRVTCKQCGAPLRIE